MTSRKVSTFIDALSAGRRPEPFKADPDDVESLRMHHSMTLRAWVGRLEQRYEEALDCVSEATFRVWRFYMAACVLEFESGQVGIYQILASKRGSHHPQRPLTRHHLYSNWLRPTVERSQEVRRA